MKKLNRTPYHEIVHINDTKRESKAGSNGSKTSGPVGQQTQPQVKFRSS
ncbi:MAG: hypothetical protein WBQ25_25955 [Nitrososphaeraceae archaeon]